MINELWFAIRQREIAMSFDVEDLYVIYWGTGD
jgi:hypothetical protein